MSEDLVFVVGASRSGTTLLARVLGRHGCAATLQESHCFGDLWDPATPDAVLAHPYRLAATLWARQRAEIWGGEPTAEDWLRADRLVRELEATAAPTASSLFLGFARATARSAGKTVAVEQTPRNIFYAERLLEIYPEARFVEIVRDPRAVLLSQRQRWRMRFLGAPNVPWREALRTLVNYHALTMTRMWLAALKAGDRLVGHPRYLRIRYEDLTRDPEATVRRVCEFLRWPFEPAMLAVGRTASSTARNDSAPAGISAEGADAWIDKLPAGDRWLCELLAGRHLRRFGYRPAAGGAGRWAAALLHLARYPLHLAGALLINPRRAWLLGRALAGLRS